MRALRWLILGLVAVTTCSGRASAAPPTDPTVPTDSVLPPDPGSPLDPAAPVTTLMPGELSPAMGPLVVVPSGCLAPPVARAVFVGRLANTDQPPTTGRFNLQKILAGDLDGYSSGNLVDVSYGEEARFLTIGTDYIVGATVDPTTGLLISTVREPAPLFGGDAVIGANDSDVACPRVADPARTLEADGRSVDTGVLRPLKGQGSSLFSAVWKPFAVAFIVLLLLVVVKHLLFALGRTLRDMGSTGRAPKVHPTRHHDAAAPASGGDRPGAG